MLNVGDTAPAFTLPDDQGRPVALVDFMGKTVVLYFYPKDDTPGCTKEACEFRDAHRRFLAKGAVVLGVSRDDVGAHQQFRQKFTLPFPLLADTTGRVTEQYGVWVEKTNDGKTSMGIERSTFVIDGRGVIRQIVRKVKVDGHVDAMLAAV